jgi:predicted negative regulator of RcsB-dependent stress response
MDVENPNQEPENEGPEDSVEVSPPGFVTGIALAKAQDGGADQSEAKALLREQTRLLHLQSEHLHEQREVQLSHLKARRISEWLKVSLQIITGVVGLVVVVLVASLIIQAATSRAVVVDAFDAPPALAPRGVTGKVVASRVLDALTRLQAATRAAAVRRRLTNAWGGDIKVEVPATGVSIGELTRLLHEMLGRDVHVDGDLVETADGHLQLTVRGDDVSPKTFIGDADDLEGLASNAAEYIYGEADPYLLAAYLSTSGRPAQALDFIAKAFPQAKPEDQPELLNQWGNALFALDKPQEAVEKYRGAIVLKPDFWKAWGNLIRVTAPAEGEEAAFKVAQQMLVSAKKHPSGDQPELTRRIFYDGLLENWRGVYRDATADIKANGISGSYSTLASAAIASVDVELHDWPDAFRNLDQAPPNDPSTATVRGLAEARQALDQKDAQTAISTLEPLYKTYQSDALVRAYYPAIPCDLGLAYGLALRFNEALKTLNVGSRWTSCKSFKGDVLRLSGDSNGAAAAFRTSIAAAPDLPFPYNEYGKSLLAEHAWNEAISYFSAAHDRGLHWADPLKFWGDALAAQGQWSPAAIKYKAALAEAPQWEAAKAALAQALQRVHSG